MVDPKDEIYGHPTTLEYWNQHMDRDAHKRYHLESPLLDVGCGTGEKAVWWARDGWDVHGFDISDFCIGWCREHWSQESAEVQMRLHFEQADILKHWPYPNDVFRSVFCSDVLEHVQCDDSELQHHFFIEVHRVLKSGGRILIIVPQEDAYWEDRHVRKFTIKDMQYWGKWNLKGHQVYVRDQRIHLMGNI
jgi:2-polyprenyl-3-methyl-5-hydroxy-6-metoxy-1,4-benzoquinol methylase